MAVTPLAAALKHLEKVADDLEVLQLRMQGIQATLPAPVAEKDLLQAEEDLEDLDATTEVRTVIACVLRDWIGPAIGDLRDLLAGNEAAPEEDL